MEFALSYLTAASDE
jgi:hypothetical protein